jgi:hypothetical protein
MGMIEDLTVAVEEAHDGLFTDLMLPGRLHRSTMMYGEWKEVGVGISEGQDVNFVCAGLADSLYVTIDFAHRSDTGPFLTGVAYRDLDMDDFHTPDAGEALGGLDVEVFEPDRALLAAGAVGLVAVLARRRRSRFGSPS